MRCYLGKVDAVLVLLKEGLELVQRSAGSSLHRSPDSSLSRLVHALGLLVDNSESLLVWGVNYTNTFTVYKTRVTVAAEICQIVWLLKSSKTD